MSKPLSRRAIAKYVASRLADGVPSKELAGQIAAYAVANKKLNVDILLRDISGQLAELGHVNGTVTSAIELDADTKKSLEDFVVKNTGAKDVVLDSKIDPSVLGGVKITLPGKDFDATIAHKLAILKTKYKKA